MVLTSINRLICLAFLWTTESRLSHARILPKKRLDNSSCCGYVVTNRGEGYFKFQHIIDFSTLTSMDQVYEAGWDVTTGWQIGSRNAITGQRAVGDENALQIVPGEGMTMTVKGGQQNASTFSAAEIKFPWITLGGVFEIEAKVTRVIGTCAAIFLYHADSQLKEPLGWRDEQDIEMLGETLFKASAKLPAGMSLLNYEPKTGAKSGGYVPFPAGVDPTADFHTYSMSWFPSSSTSNPAKMTEYRFDGALLNSPKLYASINPCNLILNHWTNANGNWSGGPPVTDAVFTIKRVTAYFDKPTAVANGVDVIKDMYCSRATACNVTV